jgi:glycerol-3-phosphate acyltransferase PlsY
MNIGLAFLSALIAYLFGSISFARLVGRLISPNESLENVHMTRADGTEGQLLTTIGATTASIKLGPKVGCAIGLLDILKGVVPVLVLKLLYPDQFYHLIAAVFVVLGHNWPVFYRFRGGGGVSATYGGFFVVDFLGTIISAFSGMIFGFFIVRDILVAYTSGFWFMLIWLIIFKGDWPHIVYGVLMNIIFMVALIPDVKEYIHKKREGTLDMGASMESFPMGRGMLKIMRFFGTEPRKKSADNTD